MFEIHKRGGYISRRRFINAGLIKVEFRPRSEALGWGGGGQSKVQLAVHDFNRLNVIFACALNIPINCFLYSRVFYWITSSPLSI